MIIELIIKNECANPSVRNITQQQNFTQSLRHTDSTQPQSFTQKIVQVFSLNGFSTQNITSNDSTFSAFVKILKNEIKEIFFDIPYITNGIKLFLSCFILNKVYTFLCLFQFLPVSCFVGLQLLISIINLTACIMLYVGYVVYITGKFRNFLNSIRKYI